MSKTDLILKLNQLGLATAPHGATNKELEKLIKEIEEGDPKDGSTPHIVTDADLVNNPDLVGEVEVGDLIFLPPTDNTLPDAPQEPTTGEEPSTEESTPEEVQDEPEGQNEAVEPSYDVVPDEIIGGQNVSSAPASFVGVEVESLGTHVVVTGNLRHNGVDYVKGQEVEVGVFGEALLGLVKDGILR